MITRTLLFALALHDKPQVTVLEKAGRAAEEERRKLKAETLQLQVHAHYPFAHPKREQRRAMTDVLRDSPAVYAGSGEVSQVHCRRL